MSWLRRLNYFEPARLRAIAAAAVALLAALGVTLPSNLDTNIQSVIDAVAVIVPLVQGELTRRAVTSPATADRLAVQDPATAAVTVGAGDVAP